MPRLRARASAPSKRRIETDAPTTPARSFPVDALDRYGIDVNELDVSGLDVSPEHIERVAESVRVIDKVLANGSARLESEPDELVSREEADAALTVTVKLLRVMYRRRGYELPR